MDIFDFGSQEKKVTLKLCSDSSSARPSSQRLGQGKLKHLDIRHLWIQEMVRKKFTVHRVGTAYNISRRRATPADEPAGIPRGTPLSAMDENTFGAV